MIASYVGAIIALMGTVDRDSIKQLYRYRMER